VSTARALSVHSYSQLSEENFEHCKQNHACVVISCKQPVVVAIE
jgi:hypothetical protein